MAFDRKVALRENVVLRVGPGKAHVPAVLVLFERPRGSAFANFKFGQNCCHVLSSESVCLPLPLTSFNIYFEPRRPGFRPGRPRHVSFADERDRLRRSAVSFSTGLQSKYIDTFNKHSVNTPCRSHNAGRASLPIFFRRHISSNGES